MTNDDKLELLFRAGDGHLADDGFSDRVLRGTRTPRPRRWIVPAVFTVTGAGVALLISPLKSLEAADVRVLAGSLSGSAVSLMTCAAVVALSIAVSLAPEGR